VTFEPATSAKLCSMVWIEKLTPAGRRSRPEMFKDERASGPDGCARPSFYSDHIEMVLMGVTMQDMVGSDTSRATRRIPRFKSLPTLSVIVKAMKGDRKRCMKANAVEPQRLVRPLRPRRGKWIRKVALDAQPSI
jgi:CheY-like chemotaxis protein